MASVATYTKSGAKAQSSATLKKDIFGCEINNHELIKLAYLSYQGEKRTNLAKTKRRGEVKGSTIKPWRQKGLGRARFGSRYNPIWRGGGITFGPLGNENYKKTITKRSKRTALKQALTLANHDKKISVIEAFECKDGKVKTTRKLLDKIGATGKTLLVVSEKDQLVDQATSNLPEIRAVKVQYLTVYELLNSDNVIISKKSLDIIDQWLGDSK